MPFAEDELTIHLPTDGAELDQDSEFCEIETAEGRRRIRFHDYDDIYAIPGLYERLFYDKLRCDSPRTVASLLRGVIEREGLDPASLRTLDLGAGNGMVGEQLVEIGITDIVGVDIIASARDATERDRPGVYSDYHVLDLTADDPAVDTALAGGFNLMTSVAALGFGDIPPAAFNRGLDAVRPGGLVVFNIKDAFLEDTDESGFSRYIARRLESGALEELAVEKGYVHRLSVTGEELIYRAFVARKHA